MQLFSSQQQAYLCKNHILGIPCDILLMPRNLSKLPPWAEWLCNAFCVYLASSLSVCV